MTGRSGAKIAGNPDPSTVLATLTLKPKRGGGVVAAAAAGARVQSYQILVTNQTDSYETAPAMAAVAMRAAPPGDNYAGTDRKVAKLSIAKAATESFDDLAGLIESLEPDDNMKSHDPPLSRDANCDRVTEEKRNVRVRAFLYAASKEADCDFHLIIGRDPAESPQYMTMEISGLPPRTNPSFERLNAARESYKSFFNNQLPGAGYHFYRPPIPVEIEGSLFFDITHANGDHPGPTDLRPDIPTIWEVHPVTDIVFEP